MHPALTLKPIAFLLAFAPSLWSQTDLGTNHLQCGGFKPPIHASKETSMPVSGPRSFAIQDDGFCSQYSWFGWERTMALHLGEGSGPYMDQIQKAAEIWNEALMGFSQRPVIEIVDYRKPDNYTLPSGFWMNSDTELETRAGLSIRDLFQEWSPCRIYSCGFRQNTCCSEAQHG